MHVGALVRGGEADEEVGVEVLDRALEHWRHGMVRLVDDDVVEVSRVEPRVAPGKVAVGADKDAVLEAGECLRDAGVPVGNDRGGRCGDERLEMRVRLRKGRKVLNCYLGLSACRRQDGKEALGSLGSATCHLLESAFLVLIEFERSVDHEARVYEGACGRSEVRADVVFEAVGEADVLRRKAEELDAEALAGVLLEELPAIAFLANDLRVVVVHPILLDAEKAVLGADDVVDEARVALEVGDAVLTLEEAWAVAAVDVGEVLLEGHLQRRSGGNVGTVGGPTERGVHVVFGIHTSEKGIELV